VTKLNPLLPVKDRFTGRLDIFWSKAWTVPGEETGITWHAASNVEELSSAGLARKYKFMMRWTREQALEKITNKNKRERLFKMIGAAHMWRNLTIEQARDLMEIHNLSCTSVLPEILTVPWALNTIQLGRLSDLPGASTLWIIRPGTTFDEELKDQMTYREKIGVFGGRYEGAHGMYVRHNMLNTEMSLRVSEHHINDIPLVMGEGLATAKMLVPEFARRPARMSMGDAVWVRSDGLRIIVEVSNNVSQIVGKSENWAKSIALEQVGANTLALCFVIPGKNRKINWTTYVQDKLREEVYAVLSGRGYNADYIASRIFVVGWEEWFPAMHELDKRFATLDVHSVAKKRDVVSLLDPFAIGCDADPDKVQQTMKNASLLYGVPNRMREAQQGTTFSMYDLARKVEREAADRLKIRSMEQYPDIATASPQGGKQW
jgi:hypothetical protein